MNQKQMNKITGKSFEPTLNGIYNFTGVAITLLEEISAWHEAYAGVATERDGYRFHIFYAGNGTYFKNDGPGSEYRCMNLIVEHIESEETWIHMCHLMYRGAKEMKDVLKRYRDIALKAPISEIEETRANEKSMYTWRYFKCEGEFVKSISQMGESKEVA